jgi:membrane-associated protein
LPIAAGAAKMPYTDFMTYNVLGAIVWGGGLTYLGFFLGNRIPDAEHFLFPIILLIVVVSFIPPYLHYRSEQKKKK